MKTRAIENRSEYGGPQKILSNHSAKMPGLAKWLNSELSKGFKVAQVAQKYGWPGPNYYLQG